MSPTGTELMLQPCALQLAADALLHAGPSSTRQGGPPALRISEAALARLNAEPSGRTWPKVGSQGRPPLPFRPVGVRGSERSEKRSERSDRTPERPTDDDGSDSNSLSHVRQRSTLEA